MERDSSTVAAGQGEADDQTDEFAPAYSKDYDWAGEKVTGKHPPMTGGERQGIVER